MEYMLKVLAYALFSIFGATARELNNSAGSFKIGVFIIRGCVAAFSGSLIFLITQSLAMEDNLALALAGVLGWIGPQALDGIFALVGRLTKIENLIPQIKPEDKPTQNNTQAQATDTTPPETSDDAKQ